MIVNTGVCNPSSIALSTVEACREIHKHEPTANIAYDREIRLMVYQLASVCVVADYTIERRTTDKAACKERLAELGLKPFGAS